MSHLQLTFNPHTTYAIAAITAPANRNPPVRGLTSAADPSKMTMASEAVAMTVLPIPPAPVVVIVVVGWFCVG